MGTAAHSADNRTTQTRAQTIRPDHRTTAPCPPDPVPRSTRGTRAPRHEERREPRYDADRTQRLHARLRHGPFGNIGPSWARIVIHIGHTQSDLEQLVGRQAYVNRSGSPDCRASSDHVSGMDRGVRAGLVGFVPSRSGRHAELANHRSAWAQGAKSPHRREPPDLDHDASKNVPAGLQRCCCCCFQTTVSARSACFARPPQAPGAFASTIDDEESAGSQVAWARPRGDRHDRRSTARRLPQAEKCRRSWVVAGRAP
jgi:hypothetical protein